MKPSFDVKNGMQRTGPWAFAPEERPDPVRAGSKARPHASIRVTQRYDVPPARVFAAWLDPVVASRWLFATASRPLAHVEIDARVEGTFRFVDRRDGDIAEYTGEYVEIIPPRCLAFTLAMAQPLQIITRVTVAIAPLKKGCALTLTHENVPQDHAQHIEGRWTGILYGLGVTLESASPTFHHDQE